MNGANVGQPFVYETESHISLHFEIDSVQSQMLLSSPDVLTLDYTRLMMAFLLLGDEPGHIGMVGLGGGSLPKYCHRYIPRASITVAEISTQVVALRKVFKIPDDSERFRVLLQDGLDYVREARRSLDVLLVDAFDLSGQPPHLCTQDFYADCREALTPSGLLLVNLCDCRAKQAVENLTRSFGHHPMCLRASDGANRVMVIGRSHGRVDWATVDQRVRRLQELHPLDFGAIAEKVFAASEFSNWRGIRR